MRSIMHDKEDHTCYLCMILHGDYMQRTGLEEHHVIGGNPGRKLSTKYGLLVYLCPEHHRTSKEAVHKNKEIRLMLQAAGQKAFERKYKNLDFMSVFGKNYIMDDEAAVITPNEAAGFIRIYENDNCRQ